MSADEVTPVVVRDEIIKCFVDAHDEILKSMSEFHDFKSEAEFDEAKKINIKFLIESKFRESGGDFNNPTKKDIMAVLDGLAEYASNFRQPEIIKKHYGNMMELVSKLP